MRTLKPRVVYHPRYNISAFGLERLHPFDSRKYGRAYRLANELLGARLPQATTPPPRPVTRAELLTVHAQEYLFQLRKPRYVADALELPPLRRLPGWVIDQLILVPMRWATAGTILAVQEALQHGLAINLSGGYHHASPARGEGFSIYADIALAIAAVRSTHAEKIDRVAYIDLDVHQGNGVCHCFMNDPTVFIYDQFNPGIYPWYDLIAKRRIDCAVHVPSGTGDSEYLQQLESRLEPFLDSIHGDGKVKLAIYNAGTDVYRDDPLGRLALTAEGVLKRDRFAISTLLRRGIPTVMLTSGGYSSESYRLIANTLVSLFEDPPSFRA